MFLESASTDEPRLQDGDRHPQGRANAMNQMRSVGAGKFAEKRRPEPADRKNERECKIEMRLMKKARLSYNGWRADCLWGCGHHVSQKKIANPLPHEGDSQESSMGIGEVG